MESARRICTYVTMLVSVENILVRATALMHNIMLTVMVNVLA